MFFIVNDAKSFMKPEHSLVLFFYCSEVCHDAPIQIGNNRHVI